MKYIQLLLLSAAAAIAASCVKVNGGLGENFIATSQQYHIETVDFPLTETRMEMSDSLSGFSNSRIVIGAVKDGVFGVTTRAAAMSLIPALDTIDLGRNPVVRRFRFSVSADSVSIPREKERYILQNVNVYSLVNPINYDKVGTTQDLEHSAARVNLGTPVVNGSDSLTFEFTEEFAMQYVNGIKSLAPDGVLIDRAGHTDADDESVLAEYLQDRLRKYCSVMPGIYIDTDVPESDGGRINIFNLSCLSWLSDGTYSGYFRNNNYAVLYLNSEYDGERKDTSFLFIPGEAEFFDENSYLSKKSKFYQYSLNITGHEKSKAMEGVAGDFIYVEGGGGLKPVVQASELRSKLLAHIASKGLDPSKAIISKATLEMPFEAPDDYLDFSVFPVMLSPTCRIEAESGKVTFAGLSDASSSNENQGDINRSTLMYSPDITHHLQELLRLEDTGKIHNYDVWFLTVFNEIVESTGNNSGYDTDYYRNLLYAQYYNQLYNGYGYGYPYGGYGGYGYGGYGYGYGGYGYGYDSYGYGYSNYLNYALMQSMYSSSSSTVQKAMTLDKDRYYKVALNGPSSARPPVLRVTYCIPKE